MSPIHQLCTWNTSRTQGVCENVDDDDDDDYDDDDDDDDDDDEDDDDDDGDDDDDEDPKPKAPEGLASRTARITDMLLP